MQPAPLRPHRALALLLLAAPLSSLLGCAEEADDTGLGDTGEAAMKEEGARQVVAPGLELAPTGLAPKDAGPAALAGDSSAPTSPAVTINAGATYTSEISLSLTLSAVDDTAVTGVCISNTTSCSAWVNYATTKSWATTAGSGLKTVYVKFRDAAGNVSALASDTITVDLGLPVDGTVEATPSSGQVELALADFTDAESGVATYKIVRALRAPPASCATGTVVSTTADTTVTDTGLTDGQTYGYRACAIDAAGNVSAGATVLARPAPEYDAPTGGSVSINSGAAWTGKSRVSLSLSASDPSSVAKVCISNSDTCTSWVAYSATRAWSLAPGMGPQAVNVWFRDAYGNETTTPATDSINVDTTKPSDGTITATGSANTATVSWTGFDDSLSGLAGMKVVYAKGTRAPGTCAAGTLAYQGLGTSTTIGGLTDGQTYSLRVCAIDQAGNSSKGVTATVRPAPEYTAPAGTIEIAAGAAYTGSERLTVNLHATDASGVGWVCLSTNSLCTTWALYAPTKTISVLKGTGSRTVNAWFKDIYGNVMSSPVSDSILLDQTRPSDGALDAAASGGAAAALSWNGFADADSGLASYKVVYARSATAPSSCSAGTVGYAGAETSALVTGLLPSSTYSFRLCGVDVAGNLSTGVVGQITTADDATVPTSPAIQIADGAAWTTDPNVALALSAVDNEAVTEMCVSEDAGSCAAWEPYDTTGSYTFADGDGSYVLYAWFADAVGNVSAVATDSIGLDTEAPLDGSLSAIATGTTTAALSWWDFEDTLSGLDHYVVVLRDDGAEPADCTDGVVAYEGSALAASLTDLVPNTAYGARICAVDVAGNTSEGATATFSLIDEAPPTGGTVQVNFGDFATASDLVTLSLAATDPSGVAEVCLSTSAGSCTAWETYDSALTFTLNPAEGSQTVYAWFRDTAGNATTSPVSDSIVYDATAPTDGSFLVTADDASLHLAWGGFVDGNSGIDHYTIVSAVDTVPATCADGDVVYTGSAASTTLSGLTNGTSYGLRLCAVDRAGNVSEGATDAVMPAPEFDGPTDGIITLNNGDAATGDPNLVVGLSATDASDLGSYCLSASGGACTSWTPWGAEPSFTLSGADGMKIVYAWFRDVYGNTSTSAAAASILLDTTAPTGGAVSIAAAGDNAAHLSWSGFTDTATGVARYLVVYAEGATAPASCAAGTAAYSGTAASTTVSGLQATHTYAFRVCGVDAVGNTSAGVTTSITTADTTAPGPNSISIAADAIAVKTSGVTLTLSSTDEVGATQMCVSNTATCTTWAAYATSKSWTLTTGAGAKTVYVAFKDAAGNTSAMVSDTIIVDATVPTSGTVSGSASGGTISLSWSGFTDVGSGIASYKVVYATGASAPASCSTGSTLGTTTSTSITHPGVTVGTTYRYRVCAIDNAGNMGTGTTKNVVGA